LVNLNSRQAFKVILFILENKRFKQTGIHKTTGVSLGRANEVVQWLTGKNLVAREGNYFVLIDPVGLLSSLQFFRDMNSLVYFKLPLRISKEELFEKLPADCVLCLDSALESYSKYWHSNKVCVYGDEKTAIAARKITEPFAGGENLFYFYKIDHAPGTELKKGRLVTSKTRTVVDLACDKKLFYAKDLIAGLWGISLEE